VRALGERLGNPLGSPDDERYSALSLAAPPLDVTGQFAAGPALPVDFESDNNRVSRERTL
jgi:hypothetical protein